MFRIFVSAFTILLASQTQANENWDVNLRCFFPNSDINAELTTVYVSFDTEKKAVSFDPNIMGNQPFSENLVIQWGDPVISWVSFGLQRLDLKTGEFYKRFDTISIGMFNRKTSQLMYQELMESGFDPFINKASVLTNSKLYLDNGENGTLMQCVAEAPKF